MSHLGWCTQGALDRISGGNKFLMSWPWHRSRLPSSMGFAVAFLGGVTLCRRGLALKDAPPPTFTVMPPDVASPRCQTLLTRLSGTGIPFIGTTETPAHVDGTTRITGQLAADATGRLSGRFGMEANPTQTMPVAGTIDQHGRWVLWFPDNPYFAQRCLEGTVNLEDLSAWRCTGSGQIPVLMRAMFPRAISAGGVYSVEWVISLEPTSPAEELETKVEGGNDSNNSSHQ